MCNLDFSVGELVECKLPVDRVMLAGVFCISSSAVAHTSESVGAFRKDSILGILARSTINVEEYDFPAFSRNIQTLVIHCIRVGICQSEVVVC